MAASDVGLLPVSIYQQGYSESADATMRRNSLPWDKMRPIRPKEEAAGGPHCA